MVAFEILQPSRNASVARQCKRELCGKGKQKSAEVAADAMERWLFHHFRQHFKVAAINGDHEIRDAGGDGDKHQARIHHGGER